MEPQKVIYFVYGAGERLKPLAPGTALYARVFTSEFSFKDYKWNQGEWVDSDYLGYLTVTGSPDLDNVTPDALPAEVTKF